MVRTHLVKEGASICHVLYVNCTLSLIRESGYLDTDIEYHTIIHRINQIKPLYAIVAKEVGDNNTPHLQGFVHLKSKVRLNGLKRLQTTRIHAELARGNDQQNQTYCSKQDKEPFQFGQPQMNPNSKVNQSQKFRTILATMPSETFLNDITTNGDLLATYTK